MDIFSNIKTHFNIFTKAEKVVASFVVENPKKVLYMSITDLADECHVGDTSVFRFCKKLKLKGYQDFKVALAQNLPIDSEGTTHLVEKINDTDGIEEITKKIYMTNNAALEETYQLIKKDDIERAVEWMIHAPRIVFFGVGTSLYSAMEGMNRFMRITPKVECVVDAHLQAMRAALLEKDDIAIAISYSGATKDMIEIVKIAKEKGAKVICITKFIKSPLTHYADITLLCGANEGPFQGGSLSAKITQLYLLDVLYVQYFRKTSDVSKENKQITAEAVTDKIY